MEGFFPPSWLAQNEWYKALPRRQKESLRYQMWRARAQRSELGPVTSWDLSQSIGRVSRGYNGICQTLTLGMQMWLAPLGKAETWLAMPMLGIDALSI